jgi:hypothetical protein
MVSMERTKRFFFCLFRKDSGFSEEQMINLSTLQERFHSRLTLLGSGPDLGPL